MADEQKIPLSYECYAYLDIQPGGASPSYELIGEGIDTLTPTQNPQVNTRQYIHEINATTVVTALQKQFAYSGERVVGDPVNDFLASLVDKVGDSLKTTMVVFDSWEETETTGTYTAKKYDVVIAVSNSGDRAGGSSLSISGTIYVNGDPVDGEFVLSTKTFTAADAE